MPSGGGGGDFDPDSLGADTETGSDIGGDGSDLADDGGSAKPGMGTSAAIKRLATLVREDNPEMAYHQVLRLAYLAYRRHIQTLADRGDRGDGGSPLESGSRDGQVNDGPLTRKLKHWQPGDLNMGMVPAVGPRMKALPPGSAPLALPSGPKPPPRPNAPLALPPGLNDDGKDISLKSDPRTIDGEIIQPIDLNEFDKPFATAPKRV